MFHTISIVHQYKSTHLPFEKPPSKRKPVTKPECLNIRFKSGDYRIHLRVRCPGNSACYRLKLRQTRRLTRHLPTRILLNKHKPILLNKIHRLLRNRRRNHNPTNLRLNEIILESNLKIPAQRCTASGSICRRFNSANTAFPSESYPKMSTGPALFPHSVDSTRNPSSINSGLSTNRDFRSASVPANDFSPIIQQSFSDDVVHVSHPDV